MSLMSTALSTGLTVLATAKGESLQYATAPGQAFAAMTGFVLVQERPEDADHDSDTEVEAQTMRASLKGPVTPALPRGYQIKDLITGFTWAVESNVIDVQQVCRLSRRVQLTITPNRGATK